MSERKVSWEEGIIGKMERFLLDRFPIGPMWARAIPTTLTSVAIHKCVLRDEWGSVKANVFITYVAPSGLGCKTPLIQFARSIMFKWAPDLLSVGRFTPAGYTEYVCGTKKKKDREATKPHPVNIVIRDEWSKFLSEQTQYNKTILEFFSDLWDGWIEGSYTRKVQFEGKVPVYFTLLSASSDYFFKLLTEDFFTQGIGNRILWISEKLPKPKRKDPNSFFFGKGEKDEKLQKLIEETIGKLAKLTQVRTAFLTAKARKLWADYDYKIRCEIRDNEELRASFRVKQNKNALKLAMIYSASRLMFHEGVLTIPEEEMRRAIADTEKYYEMWQIIMNKWRRRKERPTKEKPLPTSKYALLDMIEVAKRNGGLTCVNEISDQLNCPAKNEIAKVLGLGVRKGLLEIAAEKGSQGTLTDEEYKRFKPKRGPSPQVFRVTKKGWEWKG